MVEDVDRHVGILNQVGRFVRLVVVCVSMHVRSRHTSAKMIRIRHYARLFARWCVAHSGERLPDSMKNGREPTETETREAFEATAWEFGRAVRNAWIGQVEANGTLFA